MATLSHAESRRLYSWWWDSHISPKNSKWLQENLTDMDMKVKAMIKLIEEDADSFRRRAEMYYRKRPELMKLVEEFYRAYRALAERYDQATGALRQAHRTMAEAFPNQIPFVVSDESPSGSSSIDVEPHTPEMLPPVRALFDFDKSQKDASSMSSPAYAIKRNGAFSEQNDAITSKEGLGQLNGMFSTEEEAGHVDFADGRVRKGMDFQEEEGNSFKDKILQEELSQLLKENQNLKNQITSESGRADKAETEVESLKGTLSELKSEKEAALLRYQLSQERISNLEAEIFRTQEDFKKLSDEMLIEITKLKTVDDRCLLLEKENQSLQLELDAFKGTTEKQQEELDMKKEELEKLNISIRDERRQSVQADMARQSMEKLHSQSQEEVRLLALEIQSGVQKLKSMELGHVGLEEEVRRLKEENCSLNEQSFSSALKITNLLDEISFLKESKRKLEDEMGLHVEENKVLQQEVCSLKADKEDLEQRHHGLTEQIGAVNLNLESLQALVKELSDGNVELKEICKKHEDEKVLHLENLKQLEKILEKNAVLENSLSDANVELEGLREKIKTLEESCESVRGKISIHISEKAVLVSHMEAIAQNMEIFSEQNLLLENSLSDVNVEFEGLRGKLKVLEESYQSLYDQKSNLLAEKSILVSQVESISQSLGNLENRYAELEGKNLNLVREKDLIIYQVLELQDCLKLEKEEYETLMQSSKSQLATLENRICLLQEEYQLREEEFEVEQHKIVNAQIEIFILKRCLCDMKEKNLILADKCQQYLETSTFAEKLISELQQESFIQKKKLTSLSERNKKLVEGIHLMMKILNIRKDYGSPDDQLLELILREIRDLQTSISNAQVDIQHLILEKSVLLTNLEQFGLDVADLKSERNLLERDSKLRCEELSVLQSEKCELLEINEHLRQNVQACNRRENIIKAEMEIVCRQLSDLREAHSTLQSEISKLLEENQFLSKKYYDLREKKDTLEEENSVILAEAMTLDYLYLIFRSYNAERALELQLLSNDLDCLCGVRNDLDQEIRIMNEKVGALEDENMSLKESVVDLEKCRRRLVILEDDVNTARNICEQLNLQIETGQDILVRKDMELLEANQKIEATQDKNTELSRKLECLMLDIDGAMVVKEESEKKIFTLTEDIAHRDNEIACLHQAYDTLNGEPDKLHEVVDELRKRERHLISETKEGTNEVKSCEIEITRLLKEVQISTINAAVFEEKMLELLITCESLEMSAMVQREMLYKEITLRSLYEDKLKEKLDALEGENKGMKEELSAYLPLVLSLWDDVASLEEHALSLARHCALSNQEKQDNLLVSLQHKTSNQMQNEDHRATASAGILELQKLHAKVEALEKVVIDTQSRLEQERFVSNASLEAAMREIEGLKSKGSTGQEEAQISKDIVLHLIKNEEPGKLQKGDAEISREKFEQMMEDIQLDHVLTSSQYENGASSHAPSTIEIAETNDQMFELWETVDCNKMEKASPVNSERDLVYHEIKAVEEEKSECYSELVAENELSIDKLELPRKVAESHQWSRSVSERLSSDAQRLSVLQKSAKELKRTMETSEWSNSPTSFEFDTLKAQLKEVEGAILHLIDINSKLTKKAEEFSASSDSLVGKQNDEMGNISERKISERARRGSEKIGRLELDLQKIQYILLKLKEEHDNKKARAAERRTRVLLRDYLYGRRDSPRRKKVHCCACMRPRTKDE